EVEDRWGLGGGWTSDYVRWDRVTDLQRNCAFHGLAPPLRDCCFVHVGQRGAEFSRGRVRSDGTPASRLTSSCSGRPWISCQSTYVSAPPLNCGVMRKFIVSVLSALPFGASPSA